MNYTTYKRIHWNTKNLINSKDHQTIVKNMNGELFDILETTSGMYIPLYKDSGNPFILRSPKGSKAADFPARYKNATEK